MASNLSNNSFQKTYLKGCIDLIKTLTIKSDMAASLVNVKLQETYLDFPIPTDKREWKYYLNISGEYHHTDTPMYVTSLDTLETIVFSKENLRAHTATKSAYQFGSRYYYILVDKYPEMEQLILGILYPANINEAIESDNGTILAWDSRFVEEQEMTLIHDLQSYTKRHMTRWSVPSYRTSDSFYPAAEHAVLSLNLVPILLNLRLERCRTEEAHSFHIKQFLASHFELNGHYRFLHNKQRMWLYRNIERLSKYFGSNEQFQELIDNVLTTRNIPLAGYDVRHLEEFDEDNRPIAISKAEKLNDSANTSETQYKDLGYIYQQQRDLTPGNPSELDSNSDKITESFQNNNSNVTKTKFLESSMIDYSNAAPDKYTEVLLRELIYQVKNGQYQAYCEYKNPKTGDYITLSSKDALIYIIYIAHRVVGLDTEVIPEVMASRYTLRPFPAKEELMHVADKSYANREKLADYLIDNQPIREPVKSVTAFYERCIKIYQQAVIQWKIVSNTEGMNDRSEAQKMCDRTYGYTSYHIEKEGTTFTEWLSRTNTEPYDYSVEEGLDLLLSVFSAVTGMSLDNSNSVPHIQKSLVGIVEKLTSYSLQYVTDINEDPIVMMNRVAVRHNLPEVTGHFFYKEDPLVDVMSAWSKGRDTFIMESEGNAHLELKAHKFNSSSEFDPIVDTIITTTPKFSYELGLGSPLTRVGPKGEEPYGLDVPFAGYEVYLTLSQDQIKSVPN